jgi:hypothetical protein
MKDVFSRKKRKIVIAILFCIAVLFLSSKSCATEKPILKPKDTAKSTAPKYVSIPMPPDAKLEATYKLIYKDHVTNEENLITLKRYSNFGALTISDNDNPNIIFYYEQGFPPPYRERPMKIFKGHASKKPSDYERPPLLFVLTHRDDDKNPSILMVYQVDISEPYNRATLRLGGTYAYELKDIVGDFDGDGNIEVLNLEVKVSGTRKDMGTGADIGVRSIYRYIYGGGTGGIYAPSPTPHFERVKGAAFEKYFMQHAQKLIDKVYPQILAPKDPKIEKEYPPTVSTKEEREKQKYENAEIVILNWLATIESTQNPKLIKEALVKLETLPYPDKKRKQEIIELLIQDDYPMLKQEDSSVFNNKQ